jgi:folate-binding protein YgfZ
VELPGEPMRHAMVNVDGSAICVVHANHTGEAGFDLIIPRGDLGSIARQLTEIGKGYSLAWVGEEAQNVLRVEASIPRYGVDFSEDNLLLEVDIDHAVSFSKGCYLGQEVVERIRSRGHVNKKLSGLLFDGQEAAKTGDSISAGDKEIGHVTSSVISPRLKRPIALGYLHKDYCTSGTKVFIQRGDMRMPATVTNLPFSRSS